VRATVAGLLIKGTAHPTKKNWSSLKLFQTCMSFFALPNTK